MSEVDEAMTGVDGGESHLPLSEDETRVLELYDKLQELRLEIAIINAQQTGTKGDEDLTAAQNALLTARARYRLRNDAIEAVMVANPILKAVHSGTQASPIERHVLSFIIAESTVVPTPADPVRVEISSHTCSKGTRRPFRWPSTQRAGQSCAVT